MMFGLQVFFVVGGLDRLYNFRSMGINKWVLMIVGFVVSILNFPGYPWPTTDGLLFASAAFFVVATSDMLTIVRITMVAGICLMSALTKQSFYPIPIIFGVWILLNFGWRKFSLYLISLSLWIAAFVIIMGDNIRRFIAQTTGETHVEDLIYVGFHNYKRAIIEPSSILLIVISALLFTVVSFDRNRTHVQNFLRWIPIGIAMLAMFTAFFDILESSRILWVGCVASLAARLIIRKQKTTFYLPILVVIGIAWCASISLGYQYPIFFFSGMLGCFMALCHEEISRLLSPKFYFVPAALFVFLGAVHAWQPYREKPINQLTERLDQISPKLALIKTNKENFKKLSELKMLTAKYPKFIAAPSIPMAYYLFDARNPLPADWLINTEVDRQFDLFLTLASDDGYYVLLEKSFPVTEASLPAEQRSSIIGWRMYEELKKIDETDHFLVLNGKK